LPRLLFAAAIYAGLAFAAGFVLGTLRVTLVEPRLGPLGALVVEGPMMLGVCFVAARCVVGKWMPVSSTSQGLAMGFLALLFLLAAELAISPLVNANASAGWFRAFFLKFLTPHGISGGVLQLAFAAIPAIVIHSRRRTV
jgi:hypothetical protein